MGLNFSARPILGCLAGWLAGRLACAMLLGYAQCADFITDDNRQLHFLTY